MPSKIEGYVRAHDLWRGTQCINLQPSENILSSAVRSVLSSDMAGRYTLRSNEFISNSGAANSYGGTRYMDEVESFGEETASSLFHGAHASLKPLSGHIASLLMIASTCRKGDTIMAVASSDGGYDGYGEGYIPDIFSLKFEALPFNRRKWNLDAVAAAEAIRARRPRLVILGQSFILFPYDMKPIHDACTDSGSLLAYDASHVMGLVTGGRFQDPVAEGADMVVGSTHKSLPGPQGGLFITPDDGIWREFTRNTTWRIIDNAHWNRIAGVAQALYEMKKHGPRYAARIQSNSSSLGRHLTSSGLECRFGELGYSRSHQLLLDETSLGGLGFTFGGMSERLGRDDIVTDTTGRLGTSEVSRLGMGDREMREVASLVVEALKGRNVKSKANKLRKRFKLHYT